MSLWVAKSQGHAQTKGRSECFKPVKLDGGFAAFAVVNKPDRHLCDLGSIELGQAQLLAASPQCRPYRIGVIHDYPRRLCLFTHIIPQKEKYGA